MKILNKEKPSENAKFSDIDPPLGIKFAINIGTGIAFIIAAFIFAIIFKATSLFFLLSVFALIFVGMQIYRIMLCLEDKVYKITGKCVGGSEMKTRRTLFGVKEKRTLERNFIIIAIDDETIIKVYTPHSYSSWIGCEITVYAPKNATMCTGNGEIIINNIYHMFISNY